MEIKRGVVVEILDNDAVRVLTPDADLQIVETDGRPFKIGEEILFFEQDHSDKEKPRARYRAIKYVAGVAAGLLFFFSNPLHLNVDGVNYTIDKGSKRDAYAEALDKVSHPIKKVIQYFTQDEPPAEPEPVCAAFGLSCVKPVEDQHKKQVKKKKVKKVAKREVKKPERVRLHRLESRLNNTYYEPRSIQPITKTAQTANNTVTTATKTINSTVNTAAQTVNNTVNTVSKTVNNTVNTAAQTATNTTNTVAKTVTNTTNTVTNTVTNTTDTVTNTVNTVTNTLSSITTNQTGTGQ